VVFGNFGTISSTGYYNQYRLITTSLTVGGVHSVHVSIAEIEYYGYEDLATLGDTSIDTTFTSIMNTPQTTGAQVYVDGSLGETFTNRVTGPTPVGTSTTHDNTNKYWELTGELTSNVTLEANTFLEGDQPHAVSVWFNSSNLEANVSNTCVFSISDQEKLDSLNLDLQSNTWHNLTYAYQGEGGSRVTYLDGRKVAEDQAEDTFGDYPPFAMTGYAQGGYVVSASSEYDNTVLEYRVFDGSYTNAGAWISGADGYATNGIADNGNGNDFLSGIVGVGSENGAWIKLQMPHKVVLSYLNFYVRDPSSGYHRQPKSGYIYGSNDDSSFDRIGTFTRTTTTAASTPIAVNINATKAYKYIVFQVTATITGGTEWDAVIVDEIELYGHKEGDLTRFPEPTRVLKYPHVAFPNSDGTAVGPNVAPSVRG